MHHAFGSERSPVIKLFWQSHCIKFIHATEVDAVVSRVQSCLDKCVNATSAAKVMSRCHRTKLVSREDVFQVTYLNMLRCDRGCCHRDSFSCAQRTVASHDAFHLRARELESNGPAVAASFIFFHLRDQTHSRRKVMLSETDRPTETLHDT